MIKHFKKLGLICLLALPSFAYAQQLPLFNQYYTQPTLSYPSAGVFQEKPQLSLLYRGQWSGLDGAPQVFSLSFANPFREKLGYNININSFEIGLLRQTYLGGGLARAFQFNDHKISIGAEVGMSFFSLDESRVSVESLDDELIRNLLGNNGSSGSLNMAFSYQYKRFNLDFAIPSFVSESLSDDEYVQLSDNNDADYLVGAHYKILLDQIGKISITPSLTWRYQQVIGGALDALALFELVKKFQLAAGYRDGYGVNAGIGVQIKPNILFTYNYDFGKKEKPIISNGFSEVGLHFSFNKKSKGDKDEALRREAERIIGQLKKEEIYDKSLIAKEDQETVISYYLGQEKGNKKERRAKAEVAFNELLDEIKQQGLARMRAEAKAREKSVKPTNEKVEVVSPTVIPSEEVRPVAAKIQQKQEQELTPVQLTGYILVVAAYFPESRYLQPFFKELKSKYPDAGVYRNIERGYDYVYIYQFDDKTEAIATMRQLRENGDFPKGWVHLVTLR